MSILLIKGAQMHLFYFLFLTKHPPLYLTISSVTKKLHSAKKNAQRGRSFPKIKL